MTELLLIGNRPSLKVGGCCCCNSTSKGVIWSAIIFFMFVEIQDVIKTCPSRVEQVVQTLIRKEMDHNHSIDVIAALTKLLIDDVPQRFDSNTY